MLSHFRARLTYANVVATLALFAALCGGTWAATGGPSPSPKAQIAKKSKVKRGPRGKRGKRGPKGAKGDRGATGATGASGGRGLTGGTGSPAASAFTGRVGNLFAYAYPTGATPGTGLALADATTLSPARTIIARDLYVKEDHVSENQLNPRTYVLTVNGTDSSLKCQTTANSAHPAAAGLACANTTATVPVPPGSTLALHSFKDAGSGGSSEGPIPVRFGWRATTP